MRQPTLALLGSPLLGPSVWEPVAVELARRGRSTVLAPHAPTSPRTPDDVLQAFCRAVPRDRDVVVVPHSNAGLYVPALVRRRRVVGVVFVDAGLPPAEGDVQLAPADLLAALSDLADAEGLLPPWTHWWAEADVAGLFSTVEARERIEREQPRLPLSYFTCKLRVPSRWDDGLPGAYLAFGDTYAQDRELAAERGWPTVTLPARHLHMMADPVGVTEKLHVLVSQIGFPGASGET